MQFYKIVLSLKQYNCVRNSRRMDPYCSFRNALEIWRHCNAIFTAGRETSGFLGCCLPSAEISPVLLIQLISPNKCCYWETELSIALH